MRPSALLLCVLVALPLAACDGGGGGDAPPNDVTVDTAEDTAVPEPDASPDTAEEVTPDVEEEVVEDVAPDIADVAEDPSTPDAPDTDVSPDVDDADSAAAADTGPPPVPTSCAEVVPSFFDEGVPFDLVADEVPQDDGVFDLGVQSGAARPESILLWTHVTDAFAKTLLVWRDTEEGPVLVHEETLAPGPAGYTHVPVEGLAPCTWYSYAFFVGDADDGYTARSTVGRFKTAHPAGSRDVVRIGATSCTSDSYQPWEALVLTAGEEMDLFLHLGDQSYNDDAETLAEYRAEWRDTLTDPGYRAVYATTSMLATWDDHEIDNNWDPEEISTARLDAATTAYLETLAIESGPDRRLWRSYTWGDTLEIFVVDSRSERRPSGRTGDDAQYLSPEQMTWLQDGLLESTAHFKVVMNSVPITNMPNVWDLASGDRWEGYAADRDRLLDFITGNRIENVWFLSGDFHVGFAAHVEPTSPAGAMWEIAVGPGGNGPNPAALVLGEPQFDYNTDGFGTEFMTTLEFDPSRNAVRVIFTSAEAELFYDRWLTWGEQ